jgi:hypothetical protein
MAASLYLMTRYAEEQRPETAAALAQCLQWIAEHPECARSLLARAAAQLSPQWLAAMAPSRAPDIPALSHPVHTTTY